MATRLRLMGLVVLAAWLLGACGELQPALPVDEEVAPQATSDVLYTLDADFDQGILVNVNHDFPNNDQLQLDEQFQAFPFINVAASGRGTVVRIDTVTGQIVGEYRTAPEGRGLNPSRTTVDFEGSVWAANRNESDPIDGLPHGSVVKIGLIVGGTRADSDGTPNPVGDYLAPPFGYNTCVDRDADDLIKTSRGLGDIRPWPDVSDGLGGSDGLVEDADDECILVYQRLPDADGARHVSVDAGNDVWVGGYPYVQRKFHKLDGATGAILASFDARRFGCGGYGGLIDGSGVLWSASISQGKLLRYDPATDTGSCISVSGSYGLGIDTGGFVWNSMWTNNTIVKISPAGAIQPGFPKSTEGASNDRGVAVTPIDDHVWVASSGGSDVTRLDNAGGLQAVIPVGTSPTGVAVDAAGKVWVTNYGSDDAMRIDPATNSVDLTVSLGAGANPYNYSDMTGIVAFTATAPQGSWTVVQNGGDPGFAWGTVTWNTEPEGSEPAGTSIGVEVRAADTQAGLSSEPFLAVANGVDFSLNGRYLEVRATLKANTDGDSPVLSDLRVQGLNFPPDCEDASPSVDTLWPPNHKFEPVSILGVTDPDGDPITITITSIFQDEPVDTYGDGRFTPDGMGVGTSSADLRAERSGTPAVPGNGRVYHVGFTAEDGMGGICAGEVRVGVPHDQRGAAPVDDGPLYDSTQLSP